MRLSASKIRSINRCLAHHGSIICGSDQPNRRSVQMPKPPFPTLRIVAVPPRKAA